MPRSRHWKQAALVIGEEEFLSSSAEQVAAWLQADKARSGARRCEALRTLRDDLSAERMLRRAVLFAARHAAANRTRWETVDADGDVLLPPERVLGD